jgi:hypothetical protein
MKSSLKILSLLCLSTGVVFSAHAVDINAGDYDPLPPGSNIAALYLQYGESNDFYTQGKRQDAYMRSEISILRLIHFIELWGMTVDPQILIPYGSVRDSRVGNNRLGSDTGFSDPIIGATFWVVNQPDAGNTGRYFGITPLLTVPLGNYDRHSAVNMGENRYKFDLQLGWVEPLYDKLSLEVYQDSVFYGHNNDAGSGNQTLKQHPTYQVQTNLRYDFNPEQRLALGYSLTTAGKQYLAGDYNQSKTQTQQARIEFQQMLFGNFQFSTQLTHDFNVESGYKEDTGINLRLLYIF